jgi:O-antigen/teichoic acid export membrane protein
LLKSSLLRSTGIYVLGGAATPLLGFLALPVFTRYLSPEDYGLVAMCFIYVTVVGILVGLNAPSAIARAFIDRQHLDFPAYVFNALIIMALSVGVFAGCIFGFGDLISRYSHIPPSWLWILLLVSGCQSLHAVMLGIWQMKKSAARYVIFQIVLGCCSVGISIWLIVYDGYDWRGRMIGLAVSNLFFGAVAMFCLIRQGYLHVRVTPSYLRDILAFGLPLLPHTLGMWAISMTDRFLLTNMVGLGEAGIYTVGLQVGMVFALLHDAWNRAWVPIFYEQLKTGQVDVKLALARKIHLHNAIVVCAALLFGFSVVPLLSFLLGEQFASAGHYVLIIVLGFAFNAIYKMSANILYYAKRTGILATVTFVTAALNVSASVILISSNGPVGAAQGTMLAYLVSMILTWWAAYRVLPMPWLSCFSKTTVD